MKCICLKLVSGEELIGMVDSESEDHFNITDPVKISPGYDTEGNFGIRLFSFMSYCEENLFTFTKKDVMMYSSPTKEMMKYYQDYLSRRSDFNDDELDIDMYEVQSKSLH